VSLTVICSIEDFPLIASRPQKKLATKEPGFTHIADILLNHLSNVKNINSSLLRHKLPLTNYVVWRRELITPLQGFPCHFPHPEGELQEHTQNKH